MAARFVGEAFLNSSLGALFDMLISPVFVNSIQRKKLNRKLVDRLAAILKAAQAVINDAERKQIKEEAVKDWLDSLKDAVYDADDLLDEVSTKAATQKDPGNFLSRCLNSQDSEMVTKIEEIIVTLESIVKEKDDLGLREIPMENMSWKIPSTSLVEMSDIYGRDEDREAIVKLLLDDSNDGKISVIPIVGMGGIGKTTLAQLVYNDNRVKQKFDPKAWVCVGEEFDVPKMTKTVLEAVTFSSCSVNDLDLVQLNLKKKLTGKKFLVVLDDMWNNNHHAWERFLTPFQFACEGSKILVTTRNNTVASMVRTKTIAAYALDLLSDKYCWLVFAKHACLSTKSRDYSALKEIGRKIVEKCKGLPLAAKTLGGLLRTKDEVADWNYILKNEIWEFSEDESKILPALRISYHYLPSYLKRCFVYCSLYPKDYEFDRDELTLLWMAEDLLPPPRDGSTLEETGYKCFNDLASRSFFQPSNTRKNLFVMHDLMHDLATFYGGKFYFITSETRSAANVDIKPRHLSYNVKNNSLLSNFLEACGSLRHVRTLLQIHSPYDLPFRVTDPCISSFLSKFKSLRVLSFRSFSLDGSLPDSTGELIHLRYLDLSNTPIVTLPKSMSNLYNLQTLKLRNCQRLKMLPSIMQNLVNLRYLDISKTSVETLPKSMSNLYKLQTLKLEDCKTLKMLPSSMQNLVNLRYLDIRDTNLQEMPKGMSKLKDLQFLSYFIVGKLEENGIRELGALAILRGSLNIYNLENVINCFEASKAKMFCKVHINVLELRWSSNEGDIVDSQTERDILDKLRPYTDLKVLSIVGYRGTIFPNWLGHSSYHNMIDLEMKGCRNCRMLPSLGKLPSLKRLRLQNFDSLEIIGVQFYKDDESDGVAPFLSLKTLEFCEMSCWQEWQLFGFDAFPQLEELSIRTCPMLTGDLPSHLPTLKKLTIKECNELACSLPRAPTILELQIDGSKVRIEELTLSLMHKLSISGSQQVMPFFDAMTHTQPTCLRSLYISDCSSAISFPGACLPASLQQLTIKDCKNLEFPMQQQQQHESLWSLEMHNSCDSLTSFPLSAFPNLTRFKIRRCENIKSLEVSQSQSQDAAPPSLRDLSIEECPSFVSLLSQSRNAALPSLLHLSISSCPSFVSFPLSAFPNLMRLEIIRCENIKSLEVSHSQSQDASPPSLRDLSIAECPSFVSLLSQSRNAALPSLDQLTISSCPSFVSFPLSAFPNLRSLCIRRCENIKTLEVSQSQDAAPPRLRVLSIEECPSFVSLLSQSRNPALLSLHRLSISSCPSFVSFPLSAFPNLTSLKIRRCENIKSLEVSHSQDAAPPRLRVLSIEECPSFVSLMSQ